MVWRPNRLATSGFQCLFSRTTEKKQAVSELATSTFSDLEYFSGQGTVLTKMNILIAEGEVRRSGRARRSTRKGDRKRKRGEEDEDELEELEERKPTRQSKRSKSKAKKQASSDEEGDVSFIL